VKSTRKTKCGLDSSRSEVRRQGKETSPQRVILCVCTIERPIPTKTKAKAKARPGAAERKE